MSYGVRVAVGLIGTVLFLIFVWELSRSISNGFAGFKGGLPFMIIVLVVGLAAVYDYYDECIRKK